MGREPTIDEAGVAALARAGDLPLAEDRLPLVSALLADWLAAANELNRKMAAAEHLTVTPITVFTHPTAAGDTVEHH